MIGELNGLYAQQAQRNGGTVTDSGGVVVFFTPGVQGLVPGTPNIMWEVAAQAPLIRELRGTQLEPDYRVVFGLRQLF